MSIRLVLIFRLIFNFEIIFFAMPLPTIEIEKTSGQGHRSSDSSERRNIVLTHRVPKFTEVFNADPYSTWHLTLDAAETA